MISIRHLKKVHPNVTQLLDVNAQISQGDVMPIIGPPGTGKSTLLRCFKFMELLVEKSIYKWSECVCDSLQEGKNFPVV
jgi:ABC-type polar amino acid transport system ATPase subunit